MKIDIMERKIQELIEQYEARLADMEDDAIGTGMGRIILLRNVIEDLENLLHNQ
jgi:predicted component of type VI protein secretion system